MTTAYKFESEATYLAVADLEEPTSEYTRPDGIVVSVIGDYSTQEPEAEPVYVGYLVNTSSPVEAWASAQVFPTQFMRVFG